MEIKKFIYLKPRKKTIKNLTNHPGDDWNPRFYPDSKKIIFQSSQEMVIGKYIL